MTVSLPHPASASTYLLSQKATTVKSFLPSPCRENPGAGRHPGGGVLHVLPASRFPH